jgi:hypothetical protein
MTRTIEIPFPEALLQPLDDKANSSGLDRDSYIRAVLSRDVAGALSIGEILSAFRDQVAGSEIGGEELDRLFLEARDCTRR